MPRQMNMDYSLCHAVANSNVGDIDNIIILYDVNCQYHINFSKRVQQASTYLSYPFEKNTFHGIGAFHVSGHIARCFPRHSAQFIPGAGVVDGEILETLWAVLNEVSPSVQTATLATRREMLDDHMLDSNWKKLIGMGEWKEPLSISIKTNFCPEVSTVRRKYLQAVKGAEESAMYFEELTKNASQQDLKQWEAELSRAQINRLKKADAMDILDVQSEEGLTMEPIYQQIILLTFYSFQSQAVLTNN